MPPATARRNPETTPSGQPRSPFGLPSTGFKHINERTGEVEDCLSVKGAADFLGMSRFSFAHHYPKHPEYFGTKEEWLYAYGGTQRVFRVKDLERFRDEYLGARTLAQIEADKARSRDNGTTGKATLS